MLQTTCFICFEQSIASSTCRGGGSASSAKSLLKSVLGLVGISYTSFFGSIQQTQEDYDLIIDTCSFCARCCNLIDVAENLKKSLLVVKQKLVDRVGAGYQKRRASTQNVEDSSSAAQAANQLARKLGQCFAKSTVVIRSEDEISPEKLASLESTGLVQPKEEDEEVVILDDDFDYDDDHEAQAPPPAKRSRGRPRKTPVVPKVLKDPRPLLPDWNQPVHSSAIPTLELSTVFPSNAIVTPEVSTILPTNAIVTPEVSTVFPSNADITPEVSTISPSNAIVTPQIPTAVTAIAHWVYHPQAGLALAIQYNPILPTTPLPLLCTSDGNGEPPQNPLLTQETNVQPLVEVLEPATDNNIPETSYNECTISSEALPLCNSGDDIRPPKIPRRTQPRNRKQIIELMVEPPTDTDEQETSNIASLLKIKIKKRIKRIKDYQRYVEKRNRKSGRFPCGKCPSTWAALLRLDKHVKKDHDTLSPLDRPYGCAACPALFHTIQNLKNHLVHHTVGKGQKENCLLCVFSDDIPVLVGHYYKEHGLDFLKCKYFGCARCLQSFNSTEESSRSGFVGEDLDAFKSFTENHRNCSPPEEPNVPQHCRICPETRLTAAELISHEVTHLPDLYCSFCEFAFKTEREMETHNNIFHKKYRGFHARTVKPRLPKTNQHGRNILIRKFRCNICGKRFRLEKKLATHVATHAADGNVEVDPSNLNNQAECECILCESTFPGYMPLYHHTKGIHNLRLFNRFDDVFCSCFSCLALFEPTDPTEFPGRLLLKDKEKFELFAKEHAACSREPHPQILCPQCQSEFAEPKDLFKHIFECRREEDIKKYLCPQCPSEFDNNVEYLHHLRQQHVERLRVRCQCHRCGKQFKDMDTLQNHVLEASKELKCPGCDQIFKGPELYQKHQCFLDQVPPSEEVIPTKAPPYCTQLNGGFPCLSCDKSFCTVSLLALHFQEHHDKSEEVSFNCSMCSTNLKSSETLQTSDEKPFYSTHNSLKHPDFVSLCTHHWKSCTSNPSPTPCCDLPEPVFECYICHKTEDSPQSLAIHLNDHYGVSEVHRCQACTQMFTKKRPLVSHMFLFHNVNSIEAERYFCRTCWVPFHPTNPEMILGGVDEEQDMLKFHRFLDAHFQCKAEKAMRLKCRLCPLEFRTVRVLLSHDLTVHSKKYIKHYCDQCGKGFPYLTNLNMHIHSHEMEEGKREKFKCHICDKVFMKQGYWKQHLRSHDEEPPLICQHCGKGFSIRASLHQHEKNHLIVIPTERTVPCPICGKLFQNVKNMKYHVAGTHENRLGRRKPKVPCPICKRLFLCEKYMKDHVARSHEKRPGRKKPTSSATSQGTGTSDESSS